MFSSIKNFFLITILMISLFSRVFATQYQIIDLNPNPNVDGTGISIENGIVMGNYSQNSTNLVNCLWSGTSSTPTPFPQPIGYGPFSIFAMRGGQEVGYAYTNQTPIPPGNTIVHALLWVGVNSTPIDLNPSGYYSTIPMATDGVQQGGYASLPNSQTSSRAMFWAGTAASAIDLHNSLFDESEVFGVGGGQQVGAGYLANLNQRHGLVWFGTAASMIDLTPSGMQASINATDGIHQVGALGITQWHAAMWSGTTASYHDLNPSGYAWSSLYTIRNGHQVGSASLTPNGDPHAGIWSGSANSFQDINPPGFTFSAASDIDSDGTIVGFGSDGNHYHALLWKPVPEPGTVAAIIVGLLSIRRKFRKGS